MQLFFFQKFPPYDVPPTPEIGLEHEADQLGKWEIDWACWLLFGSSSFFFKIQLDPITWQRLDEMV